jgi:hypothetical protein
LTKIQSQHQQPKDIGSPAHGDRYSDGRQVRSVAKYYYAMTVVGAPQPSAARADTGAGIDRMPSMRDRYAGY